MNLLYRENLAKLSDSIGDEMIKRLGELGEKQKKGI